MYRLTLRQTSLTKSAGLGKHIQTQKWNSLSPTTLLCRDLKVAHLQISFHRSRRFSHQIRSAMPFAKVEGKELHYSDHAPVDGGQPPLTIIFVHGLGSTQNYYQSVLPFLTKYRCITFDNYGAGRSKYLPDTIPETSVEAIGNDVLGLLDYLKVDKAVIVGYSMGGMVPSFLAASTQGQSRVIGGICIGPVNPSPNAAEIFRKRIDTVREGGIETMANTIPSAATGPNTTILQKAFIREMIMSQDPEGYCANCRAIQHATPPAYDRVQCPMLILAGEVDKSAPLEGCKFIFEHLATSNKKLEIMEGIGHWHCVEAGDKVGTYIQAFIRDLE